MIEINKIYNEDCLIGMKRIPDKSIDCIICDLPYGVLNKKNKEAKWDSIIPFEPLWEQYNRIIKDNTAIVLFAQGMFTADLMRSNPKMWRYNLVWDKVLKSGFLNANIQPLRQHEDIVLFSKKKSIYNPQMVKCNPSQRNHSKGDLNNPSVNRCYGNFKNTPTIITDEKFPTSIISISKEHKKLESYHPTQKPVRLLEYLIKTYSNPNDVILDNCMGSGTTAVACINTGRRFIGFEKEPHYYNIAVSRVEKARAEINSDLFANNY